MFPNDGNAKDGDGDGNYQKGLNCKRGQSSSPPPPFVPSAPKENIPRY